MRFCADQDSQLRLLQAKQVMLLRQLLVWLLRSVLAAAGKEG